MVYLKIYIVLYYDITLSLIKLFSCNTVMIKRYMYSVILKKKTLTVLEMVMPYMVDF